MLLATRSGRSSGELAFGARQPTSTWDWDAVGRSVTTTVRAAARGNDAGLAGGTGPRFHVPNTFSSAATTSSVVTSPDTEMTASLGTK